MPDPVLISLDEHRNYPGDDLPFVDQAVEREFRDQVGARLWTLPYDTDPYPGQVIAVRSDGSGIDVAQASVKLSCGLRPVTSFQPNRILASTSQVATDNVHCGARFVMTNSGAVTITFALNAPQFGVSDNFACQILRCAGAGVVQMLFGPGLTNRHPSAHTRVLERRLVEVYITSGDVYLNGGTDV